MFASNAFVLCFSLFCFFISSCIPKGIPARLKYLSYWFSPAHPLNETMSNLSNLLGLTAKTLISDCVGSWSVSQVCFVLFECQDIQMHDNLSLWCFFFSFFTFGQSPVQVKQITFSFFKILQKALVFRSKGIQNLNTEQKRTKIRHRNVKNRETTTRFTRISINRPPLFWWSCKFGTSCTFKGNTIFSTS